MMNESDVACAANELAVSRHNSASLSSLLSGLFPAVVVGAEFRTVADPSLLYPDEMQYLGHATPRRVQEFTAGRLCARRALLEFGIASGPLRMNSDRRPQWPSGVVGSISHTVGMCGAVVASQRQFRAIGMDIENIDWVTPEIWPYICTPEEIDGLTSLRGPEQGRYAALIFSAKESFYKCQNSAVQQWLEFGDIALENPGGAVQSGVFALRPGKRIAALENDTLSLTGCFEICGDLVMTGMAVAAERSWIRMEWR